MNEVAFYEPHFPSACDSGVFRDHPAQDEAFIATCTDEQKEGLTFRYLSNVVETMVYLASLTEEDMELPPLPLPPARRVEKSKEDKQDS
jgi:hypothetical protein